MMNPRTVPTLLAVAGLLAIPVLAAGGHDHGKEVTVQGEILDLACYVAHDGKGLDHATCARTCLKGGQPMGVLAADGTVYLLFADHADATAYDRAKELAGRRVEIRGDVASKGPLRGITVHGVKAL